MPAKGSQVSLFLVGLAVLPTAPKDPHPFERQSPYGGLMGFALGALCLIVGIGPRTMTYRTSGKFVEGLFAETWGKPGADRYSGSGRFCK